MFNSFFSYPNVPRGTFGYKSDLGELFRYFKKESRGKGEGLEFIQEEFLERIKVNRHLKGLFF